MEDEYKEIVRKFYEIYRPLQKKYNLRYHMHFSIYESEDDLIEIWEYSGETRGKCIVRAKETEEIDCYKRAIDELKNYKQEREEKSMGEVQLWQADGLGTDKETLEKVLRIFRSDGVQGIESQQALNRYIGKLSDDSLRGMYCIDEETALQLFVDCFGVRAAFDKVMKMLGYITPETAQRMGWISPVAYTEVAGKYEERAKKLEEQKDRILSDYTRAAQIAEDAEEKIFSLQDELAHCKADLYDFYAKAGKLPDYERR